MDAAATATLRQLMAAVNVPSYRALARTAGVSDWAVTQLRRGQIGKMRLETVAALGAALSLPVYELLAAFGVGTETDSVKRLHLLEQEYGQLQAAVTQREAAARQAVQRTALDRLEPWLLQWPTAAHAVAKNPDLPASRLLPLVQPVMDLVAAWEVKPIGTVGTEVPYDPQNHQLMGGTVQPGESVRVRYVGYRQGDRLLHRAKVSPA
jgi:DNA-binding Xre family transcriptional regulator